jgi:hypothetical protein
MERQLVALKGVKSKIHTIRGLQVMLDKDLAALYGVKPIRLREQVKRNIRRFPPDFMFQLSDGEINLMVSQNAIPSRKHLGGAKPYVFTEQGVANLSSVLKSEKAILVNIQIMRAFVEMRKFLQNNAQIFKRMDLAERKLLEHDEKFEEVFNAIQEKGLKPEKGVFFNGQVFDAYKFISGIIKNAKKSIILIDNYVDESVLTMLSKRNKGVKATILTRNISKELALDVEKFNSQYKEVKVKEFPDSHDRFLLIDEQDVYHIGASLKDLGKKWFAFSKLDKRTMENVLKRM